MCGRLRRNMVAVPRYGSTATLEGVSRFWDEFTTDIARVMQ
jgi:hypothetical protein